MLVIVGSQNPIKVNAARRGLSRIYGDNCDIKGISLSELQLPDQPLTLEDTLTGAQRRAIHSVLTKDCDLGIGLEGGLAEIAGEWFSVSWAAVANRHSKLKSAMGPCVYVPPPVMRLVKSGLELGEADDEYFGLTNSKQNGGLIGTITEGLVTREQTFTQAITIALCSLERTAIS